ncbi:MAG: ABC transporter permease [Verrucomicrobia bacterium]|nr:ABC transporter permease [Verrucomicrobiota bacterium]
MSSLTIYKRELRSYFGQPTAYAIIVIFLALSMGLTFSFGNFMRIGDASLEWSFFFWHPWIYMLLAPAVGMKLWSDEQRNGTIELLGTLPVSMWSAIIGKFLAAATVWLARLLDLCRHHHACLGLHTRPSGVPDRFRRDLRDDGTLRLR